MEKESIWHRTSWDQEAIVVTNLLGYTRVSQALLPKLLKQPAATIMTVCSALAFVPNAQQPICCSNKAAIHSYTQGLRFQLRETAVEVIEVMPPYVQTAVLGEQQANDPHAQPLDEYIEQAMDILEDQPEAREIVTERARAFRFAAEGGARSTTPASRSTTSRWRLLASPLIRADG